MRAIVVIRGAIHKYFSTEEIALEYLRGISYDGKVYDRMGDEVTELYINEKGGTSYWVKAKNDTIWDALGMCQEDKAESYECEVKYITIISNISSNKRKKHEDN